MIIRLEQYIKNLLIKGLDSFALKIIALLCMTFGTLAFWGDNRVAIITSCAMQLNHLAKLAAPLFLFVLVYSARYTSNRKRFVLRLYLAGLLSGFFICLLNLLLSDKFPWYYLVGTHSIFFTFTFVVIYIYLIEALFDKKSNKIFVIFCILFVSIVPDRLWHFIDQTNWFHQLLLGENGSLWMDLLNIFFANPIHAEYGWQFIILGVVMYFAKEKKMQAFVFILFVGFWYLITFIIYNFGLFDFEFLLTSTFPCMNTYIDFNIRYMLGALPFMLLYNGKTSTRGKWFFYIYYPAHGYLIDIFIKMLNN